jgi:hypothetical protein
MLNLYVVGCGGIGGYLIDMLPMAISSLTLDMLQQSGKDINQYLTNAGNIALPVCVDHLTLIDGDTFNPRNALRQGCGTGSKLVQRMRAMQDSMLRKSYLQNLQLHGVNSYINPLNMEAIIPSVPPHNQNNAEAANNFSSLDDYKRNAAVIFLCVDNVKTRYEVSKYAEYHLPNCIVINGGNEKTSGHVTVFEQIDGIKQDPNIYEVYPNINDTSDKRPDELACTSIAPQHDQIAVTNSIVANVMMAMFNKWVRQGLDKVDKRGNRSRVNEVIIDTESMTMMPLYHPLVEKPAQQ